MGIHKAPLRRVFEKLGEEGGAFGRRQADDAGRVIAEIERLTAGLGMGAHQRMLDLRLGRIEGRAERDAQSAYPALCCAG